MDPATELRRARRRAGVSQRRLAELAGTSQATLAAYETGRKQPSLRTLARLLEAVGTELVARPLPGALTGVDLERASKRLEEVLELAELLPFRRSRTLTYPRLPSRA